MSVYLPSSNDVSRLLTVKQHGGSVPKSTMSLLSPTKKLAGFHDEIQLEVLRRLQRKPYLTQRALAKELGISLGSINYCFQALVEKGLVKIQNFSKSKKKMGYAYFLTPAGVAKKSKLTAEFLRRKVEEYEQLQAEIEKLKAEMNSANGGSQ